MYVCIFTGLAEMVIHWIYCLLLLHLACLLLLPLQIIAQDCTIEDYLICPGIRREEIGNKNEVRLGVIFQSNTLPPTPEASGDQAHTVVDDLLHADDRGTEYFHLSLPAQQLAMQTERMNLDPSILPDHHLCLLLIFFLTDCPHLTPTDTHIEFARNDISVAINMLYDEQLHSEHSHIMANFYPVLSINLYNSDDRDLSTLGAEAFTDTLQAIGNENLCPHIYDTVLEMIIGQKEMLVSVSAFTKTMGWKRIGILADCQASNEELFEQWPVGNTSLSFSCYERDNFIGPFQNFEQQELFIYVFLGELKSYFQLLKRAHKYGVVGSR